MKAVIQRVSSAKVVVDEKVEGQINNGLLVLLGVSESDNKDHAQYLVDKIINLRIFHDNDGKMNLSLLDLNYDLLVVSQFTLYGDCKKGRRPNFMEAARPEKAEELYEEFIRLCKEKSIKVQTGVFGANMEVSLINDGPVTIIIDSVK